MTADPLNLAALREVAEPFLVQCGACDAGLPMLCACSVADPRPVIAALLDLAEGATAAAAAVERVRALADEMERECQRIRDLLGPDPDGDYNASVASTLGEIEATEALVCELRAALEGVTDGEG